MSAEGFCIIKYRLKGILLFDSTRSIDCFYM